MMEENLNTQNEVHTDITDRTCKTDEKKKCACNCNTILTVVLLIAVIVLYILHFINKPSNQQQIAQESGTTGITIGYINTDSLIDQYEYAIELNDKMKHYTNMEANYKNKMAKFQEDYNNYLKTGANMTLTDQKKTEESLKKRAADLEKLENQILAEQQKMETVITVDQKKMIEAVYAFIEDYNAKHQKFTVILKKSFSESPVLYIDSSLNITHEIIDGLNKEYREYKKGEK